MSSATIHGLTIAGVALVFVMAAVALGLSIWNTRRYQNISSQQQSSNNNLEVHAYGTLRLNVSNSNYTTNLVSNGRNQGFDSSTNKQSYSSGDNEIIHPLTDNVSEGQYRGIAIQHLGSGDDAQPVLIAKSSQDNGNSVARIFLQQDIDNFPSSDTLFTVLLWNAGQ